MHTSQVRKIVQGQFELFQQMYNPFIEEFAAQDLLRMSSSGDQKLNLIQVSPNLRSIQIVIAQIAMFSENCKC